MDTRIEMLIKEYEEKLRTAMIQSNVKALDELLAPDLVFTSHLGQLLTKHDDLEAHSSGIVKLRDITPSEQNIKVIDGTAVVTVKVHIVGSIGGNNSEGDFRFTRVWSKKTDNTWQVIAAHSSVVV